MSPRLLPLSVDEDVRLELESHLDLRAEELTEAGWEPLEARREAARLIGDIYAVRRGCEREAGADLRLRRARAAAESWLRAARHLAREGPKTLRTVAIVGVTGGLSALLITGPPSRAAASAMAGHEGVSCGVLHAVWAILLLMSVVHLSSAFLARGAERRSERMLRRALGAPPGGTVAEILVDALLLGLLGGVVGTGMASAVVGLSVLEDAGVAGAATGSTVGMWIRATALPAVATALMIASLGALTPAWKRANENLQGSPRPNPVSRPAEGARRALVLIHGLLAGLLLLSTAPLLGPAGPVSEAPLSPPAVVALASVLLLGLTTVDLLGEH